jgi:hypothetical protein
MQLLMHIEYSLRKNEMLYREYQSDDQLSDESQI